MIFTPTELEGAYLIELERRGDERGFFARTYCEREFEAHGLSTRMVQSNTSLSRDRGTLRGMHYQTPPHAEDKLIRCTHGSIYDVIVDIREGSQTFGKWIGVELTAENYRMLYVPKGFAHGFVTLAADVQVSYQVSEFYEPTAERGARYDDPAFGIEWPVVPTVVSDKDGAWPPFGEGVRSPSTG
jgi:dTDP-4-dehydrorhamnose 3,5-epimerase